ncbi:MAG TPA: M20 family metallopeptidase [Chitinispirillaceae bacterium]|nr:M20 family metallopeptidase [Chitinispirillaceae bacterium]
MDLIITDKELNLKIDDCLPEIISIRRAIHKNPELSGDEKKTAATVYGNLEKIGLKPSFHLDKTAVSASIDNGGGKTIVLRADMDALPIQEQTGLPYASKKKGVMHACGHDFHTAILLGAASVLNNLKNRWKGKIVFLFQPSEEVEPGGAYQLIKAGVFSKKADAIFGLHVSTDHPYNIIGIKEGVDFAGITTFDITIKGKGGHGGTPEKTVDPVVCSAALITQLQTIISREVSRFTPATLTIGSLHAGNLRNIIPDHAIMQGTLRTHTNECMDLMIERIKNMTNSTAKAFRATAEVSFNRSYPPGYNNPDLLNQFFSEFSRLAGPQSIIRRESPTMYAEDFSYYQQLVPGIFVHLGVSHEKKHSDIYSLHSSKFTPDERAIKTGIAAHTIFAMKLLPG